jgi:hypothetical protein
MAEMEYKPQQLGIPLEGHINDDVSSADREKPWAEDVETRITGWRKALGAWLSQRFPLMFDHNETDQLAPKLADQMQSSAVFSALLSPESRILDYEYTPPTSDEMKRSLAEWEMISTGSIRKTKENAKNGGRLQLKVGVPQDAGPELARRYTQTHRYLKPYRELYERYGRGYIEFVDTEKVRVIHEDQSIDLRLAPQDGESLSVPIGGYIGEKAINSLRLKFFDDFDKFTLRSQEVLWSVMSTNHREALAAEFAANGSIVEVGDWATSPNVRGLIADEVKSATINPVRMSRLSREIAAEAHTVLPRAIAVIRKFTDRGYMTIDGLALTELRNQGILLEDMTEDYTGSRISIDTNGRVPIEALLLHQLFDLDQSHHEFVETCEEALLDGNESYRRLVIELSPGKKIDESVLSALRGEGFTIEPIADESDSSNGKFRVAFPEGTPKIKPFQIDRGWVIGWEGGDTKPMKVDIDFLKKTLISSYQWDYTEVTDRGYFTGRVERGKFSDGSFTPDIRRSKKEMARSILTYAVIDGAMDMDKDEFSRFTTELIDEVISEIDADGHPDIQDGNTAALGMEIRSEVYRLAERYPPYIDRAA